MSDVSKIDRNFHVSTQIQREGLLFRDAEDAPFRIYGLMREDGHFCRLPDSVASTVNDGVKHLALHTAGGRVRFVTDSPYVAIHAEMAELGKMPHFPFTGSIGFDMYGDKGEGQRFIATFVPPFDIADGYESVQDFPEAGMWLVTINFPLYSNVRKLYIGLKEDAVLSPAPDYAQEKPVVYYGSSITQGGCASRPGNAYQAIISRSMDANFINLGFSGSARGEQTIVDYLAALDMSVEELGDSAYIARSTVYRILDGKQKPLQDALLRMAFALQLDASDTQLLLKTGQRAALTASRPRDVAILFGLKNGLSLDEMDVILLERGMAPLMPVQQQISDFLAPKLGRMTVPALLAGAHVSIAEVNAALEGAAAESLASQLDLLEDYLGQNEWLCIGATLGLNGKDMQHLLRIAHRAFLNTTQLRDACILRGLDGGRSLDELNGLLAQEGHAPLY